MYLNVKLCSDSGSLDVSGFDHADSKLVVINQ